MPKEALTNEVNSVKQPVNLMERKNVSQIDWSVDSI